MPAWEPMPAWYIVLNEASQDPGTPSEIRAACAAALDYVEQLRVNLRDAIELAERVADDSGVRHNLDDVLREAGIEP